LDRARRCSYRERTRRAHHCNTAQGERRWVVAQRDLLECTERITGRQRASGRGDEGVHTVVYSAFGARGAAQAPHLQSKPFNPISRA
jgi:hypothetical protein